jgi:hypothetical protein
MGGGTKRQCDRTLIVQGGGSAYPGPSPRAQDGGSPWGRAGEAAPAPAARAGEGEGEKGQGEGKGKGRAVRPATPVRLAVRAGEGKRGERGAVAAGGPPTPAASASAGNGEGGTPARPLSEQARAWGVNSHSMCTSLCAGAQRCARTR